MTSAPDQPIQCKSFFVGFRKTPWDRPEADLRQAFGTDSAGDTLLSEDRRMFLGYIEDRPTAGGRATATGSPLLCLGDSADLVPGESGIPMANATLIKPDLNARRVHALSSIIGLPPLFQYEDEQQRILTSDPFCLVSLVSRGLQFEPEAILDLCSYGFVIGQRTLFQNLQLVPAGTSLDITSNGTQLKFAWKFHAAEPMPDWNEYTELQIEAFLRVLRRMELSNSFLSLTAGLDTRTIFTALIGMKRPIPSYTLSGEIPSLDAKTARTLCKHYGVPHEIIPLDAEFRRNLADYTIAASRLSCGLASLGQAHQVYLYKKLPRAYSGRVSGNMGNQLGRKGVERVSMRSADPAVLEPELRKRIAARPAFAWDNRDRGCALGSHEFLFQEEFTFTQLANYMVGQSFAIQQSPYASRELIGLCYRQPRREEADARVSKLRLRLNDLHHRFLGEPELYSFQRRLIHRSGGFAASYPINWGWRAKGGVSFPGAVRGLLTAVDGYTERSGWDTGFSGRVLRGLGVTGLHEHRKPKVWLRESLRDFTHDTLLSTEAKNSGVLDIPNVTRMLDQHYKDHASHHGALVVALDLALAAINFRAKLGSFEQHAARIGPI